MPSPGHVLASRARFHDIIAALCAKYHALEAELKDRNVFANGEQEEDENTTSPDTRANGQVGLGCRAPVLDHFKMQEMHCPDVNMTLPMPPSLDMPDFACNGDFAATNQTKQTHAQTAGIEGKPATVAAKTHSKPNPDEEEFLASEPLTPNLCAATRTSCFTAASGRRSLQAPTSNKPRTETFTDSLARELNACEEGCESFRAAILVGDMGTYIAPRETFSLQGAAHGSFSLCRQIATKLVRWRGFDAMIACFVFVDFMLLGVDAEHRLHPEVIPQGVVSFSETMNWTFKVVYCVELFLRLTAYGFWWCARNPFIRLDAFLVVASLVETAMEMSSRNEAAILEQLTVVRILRGVRIARVARVTVQLRTLWLLMAGLAHSATTIIWTCVLIGSITYIFAIVGMELAGSQELPTDTEAAIIASEHFGTLMGAMMTLLQVLTLDSAGAIYRPLIMQSDRLLTSFLYAVYFLLYIFVVSIALMNLVMAVMVEGSMSQAAEDAELIAKLERKKKTHMLPEIVAMFEALDLDKSGEVSEEELHSAPEALKERLAHITGFHNPAEFVHLLDIDGNGRLKVEEFMHGLLKCARGATFSDFKMDKILMQTDMLKEFLLDGAAVEDVTHMATARKYGSWSES
eukprot:TRINITY_DN6364_c0_g1_i6.p1 TRINITY_DN6364_c0_g1~~TRINITY_DN6364_c0_g1_i6.p1  ORF type:complete len:632 (-),score=90.60 TRINITY_DN6364_c0_g1_i6:276-2171(-)